ELGNADLGEGNGDVVLAATADELAARDVLLELFLDPPADDLLETVVVLLDPEDHADPPSDRNAPAGLPATVRPRPGRGMNSTSGSPSVAGVAPGEDAGHVMQHVGGADVAIAVVLLDRRREEPAEEGLRLLHVGGADVAIAVVLLQPALHDVDLLLGVLVHDRGD